MEIITSISEMQKWRRQLHLSDKLVGFIPTMGCLHEGHISLIKNSVDKCDFTVVSIFVNPIQFGPKEDFESYPRIIDSDKAIISTFSNSIKIGPFRTIYEGEKFLCIHRYSKLLERENLCVAIINAVTYRDSKIITQESVVEYLDYDPSENQDWDWEDYE